MIKESSRLVKGDEAVLGKDSLAVVTTANREGS
jgi:hypothetical protein